ncbi:MAG: HNH nuclease family protein [Lentisphaerae bacterium]|nr:HNH nuclease family protein [Lentisphaerota bacterium]
MKTSPDPEKKARLLAELRRDRELRQKSYRECALKLFPHVCARCGRELSGKRLRELTVHHKDHDHRNNPPDGRNWELLCLYCHDHEHEKYKVGEYYDGTGPDPEDKPAPSIFKPFEGLDNLLKDKGGGRPDALRDQG